MTDKQRKELKSIVKNIFLVDYKNNYVQYSEFSTQLQQFCIKHKLYSTLRTGSWIKNELVIFEMGNGAENESFEYNILKEKRKLKIKSLYE